MPEGEELHGARRRLARRYYVNVSRALAQYLEGDAPGRVRSDREGNQIVVTFVLEDADHFHHLLEDLNADSEP